MQVQMEMRAFGVLYGNCNSQCKPIIGIILPSIFTFTYRSRKIKNSKKLKKMKTLSKGIIVCAVPTAQGNSTWEGLKSCTRYFCQFPHLLLTVWNADLIVQAVKIMARGMQRRVLTTVHGSPTARYTRVACCASAYAQTLQRSPSPLPCWSQEPSQEPYGSIEPWVGLGHPLAVTKYNNLTSIPVEMQKKAA